MIKWQDVTETAVVPITELDAIPRLELQITARRSVGLAQFGACSRLRRIVILVMDAAKMTQRYDELIARFGEDPFQPKGVCQQADDVAKALETATPAERRRVLEEATRKSLHCAELLEQALDASAAFARLDAKLRRAHDKASKQEKGEEEDDDDDDDEDEDMEEDEDPKAELLLKDLIAASNAVDDANRHTARLGVVHKTTKTSRTLLSLAEQRLEESLAQLDATAQGQLQDEFRDLYMDEFTSAFGDEIDQFRREDKFESKDVTYLISCIHAGADVFTPLQKKLVVESIHATK
ncbi:TPA: hypothetical protein N0F65_009708 [Lagenidium giganteum]|uniref:Ribosome assembly protein 3 n=1 Tax=Lagenidium giganteum TaxID=4803 RepID=A0AAV2YII8_9STRA|nr:TPA: hypothetical protein N0F65_009708 [Lagenidium giganteum]